MTKEKLKNKLKKELKEMLSDKKDSLKNFRFKVARGKTKNVKEGKTVRREIACILTEINKRITNNK